MRVAFSCRSAARGLQIGRVQKLDGARGLPIDRRVPARVALITGGTRGLGRSIAEALARAGHVPALIYREDSAHADAALQALAPLAPSARAYRADVSSPEDVEALVARVEAELGPPAVLVHAAFRSGRAAQKTHELDVTAWKEDLATNLDGAFLMARACLPAMIAARFGRLVLVGSLAARGEPGRVAYATAKAALAGLVRTLAQEYAADGITANVVSPGFLETGAFLRLDPQIQERALRRVPSRRAGRADEVAALIAHLASDEGGYLTGQVIEVDGGAR